MNKLFREQTSLIGTVERRRFDTVKLNKAKAAMLSGASDVYVQKLVDQASKPQFADNFIWKIVHRLFNLDIQIPFLTGQWTTAAIKRNLVTTVGKKAVADQLGGTTTSPMTALALGTGTDAATAGDTTLQTEISTNGGARSAATVSNQTTTTAGDTERWVKTWTITGNLVITEEGVLDNNASGGVLLARQVFSAVNVVDGDSFQVTHNVQVTTS